MKRKFKNITDKINWVRTQATDEEIKHLLGVSTESKLFSRVYLCVGCTCFSAYAFSTFKMGIFVTILGGCLGLSLGIWSGWYSNKEN